MFPRIYWWQKGVILPWENCRKNIHTSNTWIPSGKLQSICAVWFTVARQTTTKATETSAALFPRLRWTRHWFELERLTTGTASWCEGIWGNGSRMNGLELDAISWLSHMSRLNTSFISADIHCSCHSLQAINGKIHPRLVCRLLKSGCWTCCSSDELCKLALWLWCFSALTSCDSLKWRNVTSALALLPLSSWSQLLWLEARKTKT